uniref:Uncharacterized protein n=1 Tax=Anguilla anguilla TaxID=7936 RepID=A0A0E9RT44_ANGAN
MYPQLFSCAVTTRSEPFICLEHRCQNPILACRSVNWIFGCFTTCYSLKLLIG